MWVEKDVRNKRKDIQKEEKLLTMVYDRLKDEAIEHVDRQTTALEFLKCHKQRIRKNECAHLITYNVANIH